MLNITKKMRALEHMFSDKASHILKQFQNYQRCRTSGSNDSFSILHHPPALTSTKRLKLFRLTVFFSLSGYKCVTLFGWILETALSIAVKTLVLV